MSRRKQTKPYKVEEEVKEEKRLRSRRSARESEPVENLIDADIGEADDEATIRTRSYTKCDECGKTLASSLSLARHKLTHSENKPYRCPHCNAGFKTSSNMHRHVRIHFRDTSADQADPEPVVNKSCLSMNNQRSSRQNIRTPNKFREFDVDLVRIGPRSSELSHSKSKRVKEEFDPEIQDSSEKMKSDDNLDDNQEDYDTQSDSEPPPKAEDLVCHICSKTFISKFGLLTHTLTHNVKEDSSDPLRCHLCDQTFSTRRGLMMHNVVEHKVSKDKVNVKENDELFQKMAELDFSSMKFPHLAEKVCAHLNHRTLIQDNDHIFLCKKCNVSFPLLEALRIHIRDKHRNRTKKKAEDLFSSITLVKNEDLKTIKDELEIVNGKDDDVMYTSKLLSIKYIPKWLQNQPDTNLTAYAKEPTDAMIPYTSKLVLFDDVDQQNDTCDKSPKCSQPNSATKRKLRNQVDSSSILRRFDSTVPRKIDINKISGEKNVFWCKICNYSSHEKSALVRHLLTHSGIRPYFCKVCDYAFTTKANCERHVRKRHNCVSREQLDAAVRCDWELLKKAPREDIYMISGSNSACPVCQKSFSCNNELKLHMKTHEERHFVCQLCGVRCTTRNNCVRHILHKHPGIPHQEANNIITFCGNGPNDLDLDIDAMTTDGTEDSSDVDISRGRLGNRSNAKQSTNWKKPSLHRRPEIRQSTSKRPRLVEPNSSKRIPESESREVSNQEEESKIEDDVRSNAGTHRSSKIIPLIPLLKIKAYNEAAAKSYAQMVALYEHLNFLNPVQQNENLLNVAAALNQTVDESLNEVPAGDEAYLAGETTFICHTCAKAFDSKELLETHVPQCEYIAADDVADKYHDPNEMDFGSQENENGHPEGNDLEYNGNLVEDEWDHQNEVEDLSNHQANGVVNPMGDDFINWQENAEENPSYNAKSSEESVSTQEYDSAYGSDKLRPGTYGKEPSYVEDSLLMSMFGDGESSESKGTDINNISSARYSSDLPTMVDMTGGSVSNVNFQGTVDAEDKALVKRNYHGRQCPQCNKTFPWASSLRRHIMTHTGLKLYMCRLCKMRFTTRSNLIRHVYRRHGMAKQHPEFASCLAKLNPSDSLLREVEADVRRHIDKRRRIPGTRNAYERLELDDKEDEESSAPRKVGIRFNNFQSMLEDDPDTMLVDLDYSPRDELNGFDEPRQNNGDPPDEADSQEDDYGDKEEEDVGRDTRAIKQEPEPENVYAKEVADSEMGGGNELNNEVNEDPSDDVDFDPKTEKKQTKSAKNSRNKQSSHFVCGLCKKIFKTVDELITHLEVHNIPHCWHCPICRVPFTNKYNCQRHLSRRHARSDLEPKYVEDSKHGPRNARGLPKSNRSSPDWKPKKTAASAV